MTTPIELLLETDHWSLRDLLNTLQTQLSAQKFSESFQSLDLFWARLALHIRSEQLQLFPALASADKRSFDKDGLPSYEEAQLVLSKLREDHHFFMRELADLVNLMRDSDASSANETIAEVRARIKTIVKRLEMHDWIEQKQVYRWPALLFDELKLEQLANEIKRELENFPPRLVAIQR